MVSPTPRFSASYRIQAAAADIEQRALQLAVEQSVEMPPEGIRDPQLRSAMLAQVGDIRAEPGGGSFRVTLQLACATVDEDPGQFLNMLFGNCSLQADVQLLDVQPSPAQAQAFGGPRFGLAGLRAALGVPQRALTACALKPQGLGAHELARLAALLARSGIDVVKDDHGIADQAYAPFAERVPAVQAALDATARATGRRTLYAPSLSTRHAVALRQLALLRELGVGMALACPYLMGLANFLDLVRAPAGVPVLAHPAFAGSTRIAPACLLGTLLPLMGADAVIFPQAGGRFAYSQAECAAIATTLRHGGHGSRPACPVPAGGIVVERVAELLGCYGRDVMLLVGGNILAHADPALRARQLVEAVEAGSTA